MLELAFLSPPDIVVILVIALILFGPNKLPEVGRQVGQFIRDGKKMMSTFTDAMNDVKSDIDSPFTDRTVSGEIVKPEQTPEPLEEKPRIDQPQLRISDVAAPKIEPEKDSADSAHIDESH
jgi:sec-independent protein translocase protein TatA